MDGGRHGEVRMKNEKYKGENRISSFLVWGVRYAWGERDGGVRSPFALWSLKIGLSAKNFVLKVGNDAKEFCI